MIMFFCSIKVMVFSLKEIGRMVVFHFTVRVWSKFKETRKIIVLL